MRTIIVLILLLLTTAGGLFAQQELDSNADGLIDIELLPPIDDVSEGDSFVEVTDSGTGEVIIDVDDEDLEIKDGGTNQINFTSNTGVDTIDFSQSIQGSGFTADASPTPGAEFTDSTHSSGGKISVNSLSAADAEMLLGVDDSGGDNQTYIELDGGSEEIIFHEVVDSSEGMEATYIDAGMHVEVVTTGQSISSVTRKFYYTSAAATGNITHTLPTSGLVATGVAYDLYFYNGDTAITYLDAGAGDIFQLFGTGNCGTDKHLQCDSYEAAHIIGVTDSVWAVVGGNCGCQP